MYLEDCAFYSWQDTLLVYSGTQYYKKCIIKGQVDFIWGQGRAVLDQCTIQSVSKGTTAYITADGNTDATFAKGGIFIRQATLQLQSGVSHYLGRTWGKNAHVIFDDTTLPSGIAAAGWLTMTPAYTTTTRVGEYNTTGPGASQSGRVAWAYAYKSRPTVASFLSASGSTSWLTTPRY